MSELLNKLASYHIFNYLFPGVVFVFLAQRITSFSIGEHDIITLAFLYYFVGLVISRVGSLVIEPVLKAVRAIHFADYKDFVAAEAKDSKLDTLLEVTNTYRTLAALFFLLLSLRVFVSLEARCPYLRQGHPTILAGILFVLFLCSYRKQAAYVTKRVEANH